MTKLPRLSGREVIRRLKHAGFFVDAVEGSHYTLRSPDGKRKVTVAYHNRDLKLKTMKSIIDQTGLSVNEFLEL